MKSLGVIIDSNQRFDKHAAAVVKACNCHIHALRHVRHLLIDEAARTVTYSIVGSRLDYCNVVWTASATDLRRQLYIGCQ